MELLAGVVARGREPLCSRHGGTSAASVMTFDAAARLRRELRASMMAHTVIIRGASMEPARQVTSAPTRQGAATAARLLPAND